MIGKEFYNWTVIAPGKKDSRNRTHWLCQCKCGSIRNIRQDNLKNGQSKSCGCLNGKSTNTIDLTNQTFGKLIGLYPTEKQYIDDSVIWRFRCECGNEIEAPGWRVKNGHISSCGCLKSSVGELNIQKVLQENNIVFEREKTFADFTYKDTKAYPRYDFYLPEYNRLVEYDGEQHFELSAWKSDTEEKLKIRQERDSIKNNYALSHQISLVRIPYSERNTITLDIILGDKYLVKK